jgi:hypothetical protein
MPEDTTRPAQAAIRTDLGAIFVSLELSRRTWLITSSGRIAGALSAPALLSPGGGEKMSKHSVPAGEVSGLLRRFAELRRKAAARAGRDFPITAIHIQIFLCRNCIACGLMAVDNRPKRLRLLGRDRKPDHS